MTPGETLAGRYLLIRELGRGGMGAVFEAHDSVLERDVAIKVIPKHNLGQAGQERLRREARIVAKMDHPCVAPVYDLVDDRAGLFLVMPVLRGLTLRELLHSGPLTTPFTATVGLQIASALQYSHELGVVHRDIKPDNIMTLGASQGTLNVKVMDFGVAKRSDDMEDEPGRVVGTVEYLSPEQVRGVGVDAPTDIYALGVLLFECVTGRAPFSGAWMEVLSRILTEQPPRLGDIAPGVPEVLDKLVAKCLRKDPHERPTVRAVMKALRKVPMATVAPRVLKGTTAPAPGRPAVEELGNEDTMFIQPLSGREDELYTLSSILAKAKRGQLQLCLIAGEPGMGKSRLVFELERIADSRGVPMYSGHCRGREEALPYHVMCEIIRDYCEHGAHDSLGAAGLRDLAGDLVANFPALADVPALRQMADHKVHRTITRDSAWHRDEAGNLPLLELLARTFMSVGQGRPMVIALDDLHRADVSIDALAYLFRRMASTPTLIVATYQPHESPRLAAFQRMLEAGSAADRVRHIELAGLDEKSHRDLVQRTLGAGRLPAVAWEPLYRATSGCPFATFELLIGLRSTGALTLSADEWHLDKSRFVQERLPDSIDGIVRLRLATLDSQARSALAAATVLRDPFPAAELALVHPEPDIDRAITRLVRAGFLNEVRGADRLLGFTSDFVRGVLLQDMGRHALAELHRRYAEGLRANATDLSVRTAHKLAYHFGGAGMRENALRYAVLAARQALDAGGPDLAVRTVRTALLYQDADADADADAVENETPGESTDTGGKARRLEGAAHMLLTEALQLLGQVPEARQAAAAAFECFRAAGDVSGRLTALVAMAALDWHERHVHDALVAVDVALTMAEDLSQEDLEQTRVQLVELARVARQAANAAADQAVLGRVEAVLGDVAGIDFYGEPERSSQPLRLRGEKLLAHGEYQAARAALRDLLRGAAPVEPGEDPERDPERTRAEIDCRQRIIEFAFQLGQYDEVVAQCAATRALITDGDPLVMARIFAWTVQANIAGGLFEEANHGVRDGFAVLALHVDTPAEPRKEVLAELFRGTGGVLLGRGHPLDALDAFKRAIALGTPGSQAQSVALFQAGHACVEAGRYQDAIGYLVRSEAAKLALGDRWGLAQTHAAWVAVLLDRGEIGAAKSRVDDGLHLAVESGDPKVTAWLHLAGGRVAFMLENLRDAERELQLGLRDAQSCRAQPEATRLHLALTRVHRAMGRLDIAWTHVDQGREQAYAGGSAIEQAEAQLLLGLLRMDRGDLAAAAEHLETAITLSEVVGNPYRRLDIDLARAELDIARQRGDEVLHRLAAIRERAIALGARVHAATTWRVAAQAHEQRGDDDSAQRATERANADFSALSLPHDNAPQGPGSG